jgi:predicted phage-related endonuclease
MMGASPYKTRAQLMQELATGVTPDVDAATQARFDAGHRFEALARPLAEKIVGEDLYPCVGTDGKWSASFDGLTLTGEIAWEHKSVNAELRELIRRAEEGEPIHADHLPEHYQIQMDHQALVSGARSVLFMATRWEGDELAEQFWCWYSPNAERQMRIAAGWEQFERDLADYVPEQAEAPKPIGRTPETLPSLRIEARGMVTASNLAEFKAHAMAVLGGINRTLATDEDFANAEQTVKWCSGVEERLEAAKANVLGQMADVDAVCRTIDDVAAETRRIRLELDKLVKAEKDNRKAELVRAGVDAVRAHYDRINATLGEHAMQFPTGLAGGVGQSIKGLKTLASMRAAIDSVVAEMKIEASQKADMMRACMAIIAEHSEHAHLFPDRLPLCASKSPEDLRNLVAARIAEHQRREEHRIREAEERGRQMAEIAAKREAEAKTKPAEPVSPNGNPTPESFALKAPRLESTGARMRLGDINAAIAPLSITGEGLAQLGFPHVATDKAAKLYDEANFEPILSALATVIARADLRREAA